MDILFFFYNNKRKKQTNEKTKKQKTKKKKPAKNKRLNINALVGVIIYSVFCLNVAQSPMNEAPNETVVGVGLCLSACRLSNPYWEVANENF